MYNIYFYKTRRDDYPVNDFINKLDKKSQAKILKHIDLLQIHGPNLLRPYADHIEGKIRELRVRISADNIRILYFFFLSGNIILLHAFRKKSNEVPQREIDQAKRNMSDFISQHEQKLFEL